MSGRDVQPFDVDAIRRRNEERKAGGHPEIRAREDVDALIAEVEHLRDPQTGSWIAAEDVNRLVRELDVIWNGEDGAAPQAALCDVVGQVADVHRKGPGLPIGTEIERARRVADPIEVEVGFLCQSGLNGFGAELLVESVRRFADFETFGPLAFRLRGAKITLEFDPASDVAHSERRKARGLPPADYHWTERTNGDLAAVVPAPPDRGGDPEC